MGTSVQMIERHYGTLLDGSGADITRRLNAVETPTEAEMEVPDLEVALSLSQAIETAPACTRASGARVSCASALETR